MNNCQVECICDRQFKATDLVNRYPPVLENPTKGVVFSLVSPPEAVHAGTIRFSRWREMAFASQAVRSATHPRFELREDFFTYDRPADSQVEWHLNFAHTDLFRFYGGPLFAQDEMQVAEHPALASLREALVDAGIEPLTVENGRPTPALIMGVERRCAIATDPNPAQGRPQGLYGNAFATASEDTIRRATTVLDPPTTSNIVAMEAPAYGRGHYTVDQLAFVLSTACAGFAAAVQASKQQFGNSATVVIHTGYWGCGAYGGNRTVMVLCQLVAACCTGIDALVFHAGSDGAAYLAASRLIDDLWPTNSPVDIRRLIVQIGDMRFRWGVSDGN
jgi:Poly (ADP-ribose) glycohydrolase (PARG)